MVGCVYIQEADCPVRVVTIADVVTIGRTSENTIILRDDLVSRCHALLQMHGDRVMLLDLDSTNGTFVNDEQVETDEPVSLRDGDVITIGRAMLRYLGCAPEQVS